LPEAERASPRSTGTDQRHVGFASETLCVDAARSTAGSPAVGGAAVRRRDGPCLVRPNCERLGLSAGLHEALRFLGIFWDGVGLTEFERDEISLKFIAAAASSRMDDAVVLVLVKVLSRSRKSVGFQRKSDARVAPYAA
jgi:hypothetical protein